MGQYKDSGIEWIGKIPEHWEVTKLNMLYTQRIEKVSDKDYPPLSVTMKGILPQLENAAKTNNGDDRKLVRVGDFAINSRSDRRGSCGISAFEGSVSLINTILKPRSKMNPRYYNWLFHSSLFSDEFYKWGHGIVDDLWTTRWQEMRNIAVPSPTLEVQQSIANYLDAKCGEIDSLIALQEQMIEKLKAYKQSVITEAVTKGLNPNAKLVPSGIDWIGDIPEHWKLLKTLFVLKMPITDGPHTTPDLYDSGIPFVSAEAVSSGNGSIDFDHIRGYISQEFYEECCQKYIPEIDDVYMIKSGATTGKVSIVDTNIIFTIWSPLAVFRSKRELIAPRFLFYTLQGDYYQKQISLYWTFGTQQNIGMRTLEQLLVVLPPLSEQQSIASYLDTKCADIDKLIALKLLKIEALKDYKKSVIYEAVTGKTIIES